MEERSDDEILTESGRASYHRFLEDRSANWGRGQPAIEPFQHEVPSISSLKAFFMFVTFKCSSDVGTVILYFPSARLKFWEWLIPHTASIPGDINDFLLRPIPLVTLPLLLFILYVFIYPLSNLSQANIQQFVRNEKLNLVGNAEQH